MSQQHQFGVEHGEVAHCYACRKEIVEGDLVLLSNVDNVIVWWHKECAPPEDVEEAMKREKPE